MRMESGILEACQHRVTEKRRGKNPRLAAHCARKSKYGRRRVVIVEKRNSPDATLPRL